MTEKHDRIISVSLMCELVDRVPKTLWLWVRIGFFPEPIRYKGRAIGWRASAYEAWLEGKDRK